MFLLHEVRYDDLSAAWKKDDFLTVEFFPEHVATETLKTKWSENTTT